MNDFIWNLSPPLFPQRCGLQNEIDFWTLDWPGPPQPHQANRQSEEIEIKAVRAVVTSNERAPEWSGHGERDDWEVEAREEQEISLRAT